MTEGREHPSLRLSIPTYKRGSFRLFLSVHQVQGTILGAQDMTQTSLQALSQNWADILEKEVDNTQYIMQYNLMVPAAIRRCFSEKEQQ